MKYIPSSIQPRYAYMTYRRVGDKIFAKNGYGPGIAYEITFDKLPEDLQKHQAFIYLGLKINRHEKI